MVAVRVFDRNKPVKKAPDPVSLPAGQKILVIRLPGVSVFCGKTSFRAKNFKPFFLLQKKLAVFAALSF